MKFGFSILPSGHLVAAIKRTINRKLAFVYFAELTTLYAYRLNPVADMAEIKCRSPYECVTHVQLRIQFI